MGICLTVKSVTVEEEDICRRKGRGNCKLYEPLQRTTLDLGDYLSTYRTYLSIAQSINQSIAESRPKGWDYFS